MPRNLATLCLISLLLAPAAARAQDGAGDAQCPQLPADAGLAWEARKAGDGDFCRALRADGSEAFGVYITPGRSFKPARRNRAERGYGIDGQEVIWYRAEIAIAPGVQARETTVELADGRHAHIWLQAPSEAELGAALQLAGRIHFPGGLARDD
jgi:hypothetical protein